MKGCLLDTNIISELRRRDRTNPGVATWFSEVSENNLFLSVVTIGEIRKGIERLRPRDPNQAEIFDKWLSKLKSSYADRILPIDTTIVEMWGTMQAIRPSFNNGRLPGSYDELPQPNAGNKKHA